MKEDSFIPNQAQEVQSLISAMASFGSNEGSSTSLLGSDDASVSNYLVTTSSYV